MKTEVKPTVLYVDDEQNNLLSFKATFRRQFNILTAESAVEARRILSGQSVHILISDQRMPQMTGIEFFASILEEYPDPIRILLTGYADIQAVIDAINLGQVFRYCTKPWNEGEITRHLEEAYELYELRAQNKELTEQLVDNNTKMEFLLRQQLLS
ncbi:response regulator [Dinghuibacter silviterrae]|uniref:Response regulator receiver domain-containing protein n=1 Tax=Dinghuibacter silviterrae TaxID=1539049 RepID=A0A4V6QA11_9BACT|nr:response regulator [Dinghuibacter silviterrae]TDX02253.1 response regulator receiver domain-containing protein [Dinghuibacter silviterrae]